jgi:SNF2 family DNA or RNA helicase
MCAALLSACRLGWRVPPRSSDAARLPPAALTSAGAAEAAPVPARARRDCALWLQVKWLRVVLDEGHFIKNAATRQSQAAAALDARARWLVTGTPIQNSMRDLFALIRFLRLEPLAERDVFRSALERGIKLGDPNALLRLRILMAAIAKRRLKTSTIGGRALIELPPKVVKIVTVPMGAPCPLL